jgi:chromosomal replication initiation ATPase DnaA
MQVPTQLPLGLSHSPQFGREDFMVGPSNRAALKLIEAWPDWPSAMVVLSGPPGSGKTHLVHIWSKRAGAEILPASEIGAGASARRIAGRALAIEDLRPEGMDEDALFHLINSAKEGGASLLLTSRNPPAEWNIALSDLRSRLRLATPVSLGAPDDDLLRRVLVKLFADRQLIVEKSVLDYVLLRMERSLSTAAALVDALDREALAEARRITRPMAARILVGGDGLAEELADPK